MILKPLRAIVLRDGHAYLNDGEQHVSSPTADVFPAEILDRAGRLFSGEGTVLWWGVQHYGGPMTPAHRERATKVLLDDAGKTGWKASDKGAETGWFTFTKTGAPDVHLGIAQWIDQRKTPLFNLEDSPALIAALLARYHVATGAAWRMTAGMAGCAAIRNLAARPAPAAPYTGLPARTSSPLWRWDKAPEGVVGCSWETRWDRPMTPAEAHMPMIHQFDIRAAYLAAAGVARLAWSAPVWRGPSMFEPTAAGYWRVRYGRGAGDLRKSGMVAGDMLVPAGRIDAGDMIWLTTPVMAYLAEQGITPTVHDAWTADRTGTYLKRWSEKLRDARWDTSRGGELLHPAIKATYARTIGTLGKPGGRVYRPDWRDAVVDTARINLRRKLDAAAKILGVFPLRVNIDSVYFADDDPDAKMIRSALVAADDQLGKFRYVRSYTMSEWTNIHGTGRS